MVKGVPLTLYDTVFKQQATESVKLHAIYAVIYLGMQQLEVSRIFCKSASTICDWVARYNECDNVARISSSAKHWRKFSDPHKTWIMNFINRDPLSFVREIQKSFYDCFCFCISSRSILRILEENNYSKKILEQRAMEISFIEIARFTEEINAVKPLYEQLVFLDEMSTDNRAMLRKRGWFLRNTKPVFKTLFRRGKRLSVLSFLCVNGILETFKTEGTFDRKLFFEKCKELLESGKVQVYPGLNSVWLLDGASIHLDPTMTAYFRELGIKIIFLPAYCPFYNVIEIIFGMIKRRCRELYDPSSYGSEEVLLMSVISEWFGVDTRNYFRTCGYSPSGIFDPNVNHDVFIRTADLI
eukprot:Pompholyxophrys_sp_v1_NODE_54_length_2873_cov_21.439120.p1 type:complete len:355 gc:universal NODE_54_length_2873_cov_21.439120:1740-2804(+)